MLTPRPRLSTAERLRLFALHDGVCHVCGEPIDGVRQRWEIDHLQPRALIGAAADTDENMRPAHARPCHSRKTVMDVDAIAEAKRRQAKHVGAWRSRSIMPGSRASGWKRRMDGTAVRRDAEAPRG